MATAKKPALKIPKNLAQAVDLYYQKRQDRLALQKQVTEMEEEEQLLKSHLIENIPKSEATGIAGKLARISITVKTIPQVTDWDAFYAYIAKNRSKGAFAMLNRAVNAKAVSEVWDAGKEVPGVGTFTAKSLSINKL